MTSDTVTAFYDEHPYPPPVTDLTEYAARWSDGKLRRVEHHRMWPSAPRREDPSILVAGCGTSQAAKYALRYPEGRVVGIDVSQTSIDHTRRLAQRHGLDNLELQVMPISATADLGASFDHIVCTGVLHHLTDPDAGIGALRDLLTPEGAIYLMVYATYGRTGVYMIQEYCRRLEIGTGPAEIGDLVATLREIPFGHPLSHLFRDTPDFRQPDALADALLHPRDRSYSVPEVFELLGGAGLQLGRWVRQAPYLPTCGSVASTPHGERIAALPREAQYAALELFRGTMTRHSLIAHRDDSPPPMSRLSFTRSGCAHYVPVRPSTVIALEERLPEGAAAALLNKAHEFTDLVLFVNEAEKAMFEAIDGTRTIGQIGRDQPDFFRRLYEHDLIVIDA
ncbi:MAG: class I SAM-dependent methyltransferase, partial [Acidimicrobiia bacterium]|nr:class I SAM-dependent methyltransferase [Acidimicrobiia bacterium]